MIVSASPTAPSPRGEELFRLLAEAIPQLVWSTRPDGYYDYFNRRWYEYTGTSPEETRGQRSWRAPFHPEDLPEADLRWARSLATGEPYEIEYRCRRHDGVYRWFLGRAEPLRDAQGFILRWFGTCTDIHELKCAQDERQTLASIVEQSTDFIGMATPEGRALYVNEAGRRMLGLGREKALRAQLLEYFAPEDRGFVRDMILPALAREGHWMGELSLRHFRTGAAIPVHYNVFTTHDPRTGKPSGIATVTRDITAQRRSERALRQSEERYRILLDNPSQLIWTNSAEGDMVGEQPGWAAFTGQPYEVYQGRGWSTAIHPEDRDETLRAWLRAVASRSVFETEHRVLCRDGAYRHFSVRAVPVLTLDGRIREWVGIHTDITERKRAELEREQVVVALERSNQELDQFAYVASHDLKAPLRGIANLSEWVQEDLGSGASPELRRQMELLRGRVYRMEALLDGLLDYSRAARVKAKPEWVDVGRLVKESVELISPREGAVVSISELPSLRAERVPIQQVFMNLISNALKYTLREDPRVEVGVREAGAFYEFSVRDNGPGIARAYHERIWGIFQTLETRDKVEGTGIGLSVVKKIVESRGGKAWVESAEGQGATFRFTWRRDAAAAR